MFAVLYLSYVICVQVLVCACTSVWRSEVNPGVIPQKPSICIPLRFVLVLVFWGRVSLCIPSRPGSSRRPTCFCLLSSEIKVSSTTQNHLVLWGSLPGLGLAPLNQCPLFPTTGTNREPSCLAVIVCLIDWLVSWFVGWDFSSLITYPPFLENFIHKHIICSIYVISTLPSPTQPLPCPTSNTWFLH